MVEKKVFTVLGAGVVGLCCAVSLQRKGYQVVLVDRLDPGMGTSFGNGGLIQIDAVVPIATPGILRRVPSMLLDSKGPLVVRWRYLHKIAPASDAKSAASNSICWRSGRIESSSVSLIEIISQYSKAK